MISQAYFLSIIGGDVEEINGGTVETTEAGGTKVTKHIILPPKAAEAGWYPSSYSIEHTPEVEKVRVALTDLTWLDESDSELCQWPAPFPVEC